MSTPTTQEELPELDVMSPQFTENPYVPIAEVRRRSSMCTSQRGIEILRYDDVSQLLSDDRLSVPGVDHFAAAGASDIILSFVEDGLLLDMERERHDRVRKVMAKAFTIRRVDQQRDVMERIADDLLDSLSDQGRCDFVGDFSHHYSIAVLCELIGVDATDIPRFATATTELRLLSSMPLAPVMDRIDRALQTLWDYVVDLLVERRQVPRSDFVSALIEAQSDAGRLSEEELVWGVANLLFAGHDTTRYQLASCIRSLAEAEPGLWQRLREHPDEVHGAVCEGMRVGPVVQHLRRHTNEPVEIGGHRIPPGQLVVLNMLSASRDPARFSDPDRFDHSRDPAGYGIAFGWGPHHCIGHALAKAELDVAVRRLLERWAAVQVAGGFDANPYNMTMGGPDTLPIAYKLA